MSITEENDIHPLMNVTVREFFEFAEKNNLMDYKILIQPRNNSCEDDYDEFLNCNTDEFDDEKFLIL